jgi:hypothetical protein
MKRRTFDTILSISGFLLAAVLLAAGALMNWGATFASDSVREQLVAQQIVFPPAAELADECTSPLAESADPSVEDGASAGAYAELIKCHMQKAYVSAGLSKDETYNSLGRVRQLASEVAIMPESTPAEQAAKAKAQAEVDMLNNLRSEIAFKGETLRSILLTAYAFGTIGTVASIASFAAYGLSALMFILSILGWMHLRRTPADATI